MIYVENPLPEIGEQHPLRGFAKVTQRDHDTANRYREQFRTTAYEDDGVLRWKSNDRCVPLDIFRDAYCTPPVKQNESIAADNSAFFAEYRAANTGRKRSSEEIGEMRAAFGSGTTVVDVITGDRIKL
jgi:hypothetical protein